MALATLVQAREQIEIAHSASDVMLAEYIEAASAAVLAYLKVEVEESVPVRVLPAARQATLILVAEWFKNREAEQQGQVDAQFGYGYLPQPVVGLLYPHRDPALA